MLAAGKVDHAYLGVSAVEVTSDIAGAFKLPVEKGLVIQTVTSGSGAAVAGLQAGDQQAVIAGESFRMGGDVIVAADGKPVASIDDLRDVIAAHKPGDKIQLDVYRGDAKKTVTVTLGRQPTSPSQSRPLPGLSLAGIGAARPQHPGASPLVLARRRPGRCRYRAAVRDDESWSTPERGSLLLDEERRSRTRSWEDDGSDDYEGWYCVSTDPFPCPAAGCTFVAAHMTAAHLVLVWEERDDPNLLWHAQRAMEVGRNPRVVTYQRSFGPSASYYAWEAAGRPVHGVRGKV